MLQQIHYLLGIELGQEHHRGAKMQKWRGEHIPAAGVEGRHDHQGAVATGYIEPQGGVQTVPKQHFVGVQGPFGEASGAAGVQNKNRIVGSQFSGLWRTGFGRKTKQLGKLQLSQSCRLWCIAQQIVEFRLYQHHRWVGIAEEVVDFAGTQAVV